VFHSLRKRRQEFCNVIVVSQAGSLGYKSSYQNFPWFVGTTVATSNSISLSHLKKQFCLPGRRAELDSPSTDMRQAVHAEIAKAMFVIGICLVALVWGCNEAPQTPGVDSTPPTIKLATPAQDTVVWVNYATVAGQVEDQSAIASFTVNNNMVMLDPAGNKFRAQIDTLARGPNRVQISALDAAGNKAEVTLVIDYRPDTSPPLVRVDSPSDGIAIYGNVVQVQGRALDENNIARVKINGADADWLNAVTGQFRHNLKLNPGVNTIVVRAWDSARNWGEASLTVMRQ
jgi:hypothetical protein